MYVEIDRELLEKRYREISAKLEKLERLRVVFFWIVEVVFYEPRSMKRGLKDVHLLC